MDEVIHLSDQGVREINLLGQNVNAYRGENQLGDEIDLAELIACVAAVEGIDRIRFTTSHPVEFTDSLVDAFADIPELVSHLHLPVQSGSDRILTAMKRGHTAAEYIEKMERIRANRPDISFSSDFIIGFPGETEEDFEATMNLIHQIGFDHSFSFVYSARPGTPASGLPDETPESVKSSAWRFCRSGLFSKPRKLAAAWSAAHSVCWLTAFRPATPVSSQGVPRTTAWLTSARPTPPS
ncbi:hypothetical protein HORIV_48100 [Vreelandella olivaria]|uniref:Radical SAM core domain-containing protein n=1 Tax=Vreelandella olivaria TaxID=390919 RepID=A0ABN5WZH7_9GAMM|nr:hypothetical protein HORIV_48100 [Halomonas olivaria]